MTKYWKSAVYGLGLLTLGSPGFADEIAPKDLVGMWSLVSWEEVFPDGHKIAPLGDNGKGMLVFDQAGHFVISLISLRSKYAANDRAAGSPEDNKRLAEGVLTYFGTYSVEANTLIYHIDRSSFPNLDGLDVKRTPTLTGDELKYTALVGVGGTVKGNLVWKRLK